ncbi:MAG TPA: sulfotransferase [Gammaproteobacteria bacterium]
MGKIFGIGWAKTGTTTLGTCFKILGYKHQGQRLDLVDHLPGNRLEPILAVAARSDTFDDWPWILLYQELDRAFPGSKFVLTLRDSDRWLRSYRNMLRTEPPPSAELRRRRRILYGFDVETATDEQLVARYEAHNRDVLAYFEGRSDALLTVNWEAGDGWERLCAFVGKPVPDRPLPHANRGSYGLSSTAARLLPRLLRKLGLPAHSKALGAR